MTGLPFWKTETVGNDFVLIHGEPGQDYPSLALAICDRRLGVGSDGLLVLSPSSDSGFQVDMRMFNPDGTEDFCGNGLRCAALHASQMGWVSGDQFSIRQHGLVCPVGILPDGRTWATLPPAQFEPEAVPSLAGGEQEVEGVRGVPVSTGSTHFVVIRDSLPEDEEFFSVSPAIETSPFFPERTSIMWTLPLDERRLKLRIWERGVGETLGCGTGSSAAAVVWAMRTGLTGEFIIENPGGEVAIHLPSPSSPITSTSLPLLVFTGTWPR